MLQVLEVPDHMLGSDILQRASATLDLLKIFPGDMVARSTRYGPLS